jgi:hypothetical protein
MSGPSIKHTCEFRSCQSTDRARKVEDGFKARSTRSLRAEAPCRRAQAARPATIDIEIAIDVAHGVLCEACEPAAHLDEAARVAAGSTAWFQRAPGFEWRSP